MSNVAAKAAKSTRAAERIDRELLPTDAHQARLPATQVEQVLHSSVTGIRDALAGMLGAARLLSSDTMNDPDTRALFAKAESAYLRATNDLECFASTIEMLKEPTEGGEVSAPASAPPQSGVMRSAKRAAPPPTANSYRAHRGDALEMPTNKSSVGDLARLLVLSIDQPMPIAALHTFARQLGNLRARVADGNDDFPIEDELFLLERHMRVIAEFAERERAERRATRG